VHTLTFSCPGGDRTMPSLGCRIDHGDVVKVVVPGYHKPKSYSMSAARPGEFDITFKVYPKGPCSGYLDSVAIGESVRVFVMGRNERRQGTHVGLVAFGVGITEALPIAEAELAKGYAKKVHLLWAARTYADMFWHDEISALEHKHAGCFEVTRILSQEDMKSTTAAGEGGCGGGQVFLPKGRVDHKVLANVFGNWISNDGEIEARFVAVGTKPMMRQAEKNLTKAGFPWPQSALLLRT
jgi:NAD(P)H-flavin reductase